MELKLQIPNYLKYYPAQLSPQNYTDDPDLLCKNKLQNKILIKFCKIKKND